MFDDSPNRMQIPFAGCTEPWVHPAALAPRAVALASITFCTCLLPLAKSCRLHLCHWTLYSSSVTKHSTDPIKGDWEGRTLPHIVLSSESASCPHHLPLFCFPSLSNTEINIGYLLGEGSGQREPGSGQARSMPPSYLEVCHSDPDDSPLFGSPVWISHVIGVWGERNCAFYDYEWQSLEMLPFLFPFATI